MSLIGCIVYVIIALITLVLVLLSSGLLFWIWTFLRFNDFPHRRKYCKSRAKLNGKTAIVTGGSSGIGYETAKDLAKRGAQVILGCRNIERGNKAKDQIIEKTGNTNIVVIPLDLSDLDSVRNFADQVTRTETKLHLLINNAGIYFSAKNPTTKQGVDMIFGTNYLGHFLLTCLLEDLLKAAAPSRVVNVSSEAYAHAEYLNFTGGKTYPHLKGYEISKLANILHAKELAKQFKDTGVTAYSLHPGFTDTNIFATMEGTLPTIVMILMNVTIRTMSLDAWTGAQCSLYCALEESLETVSGCYYENCKQVVPRTKLATDDILATELWDKSLKMVKITQ